MTQVSHPDIFDRGTEGPYRGPVVCVGVGVGVGEGLAEALLQGWGGGGLAVRGVVAVPASTVETTVALQYANFEDSWRIVDPDPN